MIISDNYKIIYHKMKALLGKGFGLLLILLLVHVVFRSAYLAWTIVGLFYFLSICCLVFCLCTDRKSREKIWIYRICLIVDILLVAYHLYTIYSTSMMLEDIWLGWFIDGFSVVGNGTIGLLLALTTKDTGEKT